MKHKLLTMAAWLCVATAAGADFYVATDGSDEHPGTEAQPFATLRRARDAVRQWRATADAVGPVTVHLRGGVYELNLVDEDPHFVDADQHNFQLRPDSPAWQLGFQKIPVEQIGLRDDAWRQARPVEPNP